VAWLPGALAATWVCFGSVCHAEAGERGRRQAHAEFLQHLPTRARPGHAFGQFIELTAHTFFPFLLLVLF